MGFTQKLKEIFGTSKPFKPLYFYDKKFDGYTANPLAQYKEATDVEKENEYFMQYVYPEKLHIVSLRTPIGFRLTYGYAKDFWNNDLGIRIPNDDKKSVDVSRKIRKRLNELHFYRVDRGINRIVGCLPVILTRAEFQGFLNVTGRNGVFFGNESCLEHLNAFRRANFA